MKYKEMLKMTSHIEEKIKEGSEISFSFDKLKFIEPAGAVLLLKTIEYLRQESVNYSIQNVNSLKDRLKAISYGINMGIFQEIGAMDSLRPKLSEGPSYVSPKQIERTKIFNDYNTSDEYAEDLATNIVQKAISFYKHKFDAGITDLLEFTLRELIRNIFDHANCKDFRYALQKYEKNDFVEIVFADNGVGLRETVPFDSEEKFKGLDTDLQAIMKALLPGISAYSNHGYAAEDYKNSGFGLSIVKRIIEDSGGKLCIASGKKSILYENGQSNIKDCKVQGTLVMLRIKPLELSKVNFEEIISQLQKEGSGDHSPSIASKSLKLT